MTDRAKRRLVGDDAADSVVAGLLATRPVTDRQDFLRRLMRDLRGLRTIPEVRQWIESNDPSPVWSRPELVETGQAVFDEWSLEIVTSLFCASLPFAYAAADGVEVLERMSELAEPGKIARRIAETGQMLIDISARGSLDRTGSAYETVRKVRLLHAAIRALLLGHDDPGRWDSDRLGVPVNQEDLTGTLLSFSSVVFDALDRLGVRLSGQEQMGYLQLWALVGHDLGIAEAGRILDPAEASRMAGEIAQELHRPSRAGQHLMSVLMWEMELSMPWGLRKLPRTLVRHLAGDRISDMLNVPAPAWWGRVLPVMAAAHRFVDRSAIGRAVAQAPSRLLGRSMIRMWIDRSIIEDERTAVRIPAASLDRLKVGTTKHRGRLGMRGSIRSLRRILRAHQLRSRSPAKAVRGASW